MQSIPRLLVAASLIAVPALVSGADRVAWRDAPEYVRLIAPANQRKSYSISVTEAPLVDVLALITADPSAVATPGAWQPRNESPQDAFGTAGLYNRWLAAALYGSRQPRVARGARMDRGRIVEAWTLVSPYPSADLATLHPGTMRLILKVP
ncbi:MAG: hypothetical protein ACRD3G_01935 [Vicinamibacterales bacterium]